MIAAAIDVMRAVAGRVGGVLFLAHPDPARVRTSNAAAVVCKRFIEDPWNVFFGVAAL